MNKGLGSANVKLVNLRKAFDRVVAIDDVSLEIAAGEFVTLLGASGSGKSTTLMTIAGFLEPTNGLVMIGGVDQGNKPPHKRDIGVVFQHYALFPHLSVAKNISFPLEMRKVPKDEIASRVNQALDLVRLTSFGERKPQQLSGGQQQRVALARALVYEPSILLLDEPLGALDKNLREEMQYEIRRIQKDLGITTISVTHDQQEAMTMSDRIVVMRSGQIEQFGTPIEIYERPETTYVAAFMGAPNFIEGEAARSGDLIEVNTGGGIFPVPFREGLPESGRVSVVVRPERLKISPAGHVVNGSLNGTISSTAYVGDNWRFSVKLPDGNMLTVNRVNQGAHGLTVGDSVSVSWDPSAAWLVRATGET